MAAPTYGKTQEERLWAVRESTADVLAQPDVQHAITMLPGAAFPQAAFEQTQSLERNPSAGVFGTIQRKFIPSTMTVPFYLKVPASAGAYPSYREFLRVCMGTETLATYASLTTVLAGANNDLVFTARAGGTAGNSVTVEYVDPPGNNVALSVAVVGNAITVTCATDGASAITSTAASIRTLLRATPAVMALLQSIENSGADTGAGVVTVLAATNLSGGSGTAQVVYSLATSIDLTTCSMWHAIGSPTAMLMRAFRGVRGGSMKLSGSGSAEPQVEFGLLGPYMLQAGTSKAEGSHTDSVLALTTETGQAARYAFGPAAAATDWFWLNWAAPTTAETIKATATDSAASVTIVRAQNGTAASAHDDATEVTPWTPDASAEPAELISSVAYGSITIDGITTICISFEITVDNKPAPRLSEYAQPFATGFPRGDRRTVTGTVTAFCTQPVQSLLTAIDRDDEFPITIVCKSSLARQVSISMPRCKVVAPPQFEGGGAEFEISFPFQALQTTASTNDELTLTFS